MGKQRDFRLIHSIGSRDKESFDGAVQALALDPADCGVDAIISNYPDRLLEIFQ